MPALSISTLNILALVLLGLGFLTCFFGYRIYLFAVALGGFAVAALIAGFAGLLLSQDLTIAFIAGLLGGFIGAAALVLGYFVILFIVGGVCGFLVALGITHASGAGLHWGAGLGMAGAAVAGGFLALLLQRFVIVGVSALKGAVLITVAVYYFVRRGTLAPALKDLYDAVAREVAEKGGLEKAIETGITVREPVRENVLALLEPTSLYLMALGIAALTLLGIAIQYTVTARIKEEAPPAET
ncbi:MAG: DUF4203 domain-containing protein [Candidatus Hydrogenedentota bacterium]